MKKKICADKLEIILDVIKDIYPDQEIIMETPIGSCHCKIGDAQIYVDADNRVVIDSE